MPRKSTNEPLRKACAAVFESWLDAGIAPAKARELALLCISALEAAFVLSRTLRSTEPLEAAGRLVASLFPPHFPKKTSRPTHRVRKRAARTARS